MHKHRISTAMGYAQSDRPPAVVTMVAGSISGCTATLLTYPLDFIRTRIAGNVGKSKSSTSIWKTATSAMHKEGARSSFRGIGPTPIIPYEGITFGSYDLIKTHLGSSWAGGTVTSAASGAAAGIIATVLTYPNDTVRRRLQMQGQDGTTRQYKTALNCYRKMIVKE